MPLSTNIHAYADIEAVLAEALPHGYATYRLATDGQATHWMMRANKYRLLLQKAEAAKAGIKGFQPPTPYDRMKLTRKGSAVEIDFNPQPKGKLSLPSGEVIHPTAKEERAAPPPPPAAFTPKVGSPSALDEAAAELLKEFGDEN